MPEQQPNAPALTDVSVLLGDLAAGTFERMVSVALSQVAAAVVDTGKKGNVTLTFDVEKITGTKQVNLSHAVKFTKPTESGKSIEEATLGTVMHVGRGGRLTLAPETQMAFFDRAGEVKPAKAE